MQLTTRGRYAVMAMVDLAMREMADSACDLVRVADIAGRQQLSQSYLEQLFGKLRRADLVCSARGPGGGYRLARPPSEIAIADIVAAVDEPINATRCESGSGGCMLAPGPAAGNDPSVAGGGMCQTHDLWFELGRQITLFLRGVTLADVVLGRVAGRAARLPSPAAGPE
jgi:Rrf2 family iron-sulfur cluster assembly transcriptional regulator